MQKKAKAVVKFFFDLAGGDREYSKYNKVNSFADFTGKWVQDLDVIKTELESMTKSQFGDKAINATTLLEVDTTKSNLTEENIVVRLLGNFYYGVGPENYLFNENSHISGALKDAIIVNDALKDWITKNYGKISKKDYDNLEDYDNHYEFKGRETIGQPLTDSLSGRASITLSSFIGSAHVYIIPKRGYVSIIVKNTTNLPSGDLTKEITQRLFPNQQFLKPIGILRDPQKSIVLEHQESCSNISQVFKFKMTFEEIKEKQWFNGLLDLLEREFKETKDDILKHIKDIENKLIEFVK